MKGLRPARPRSVPTGRETRTGCDYCAYRHICGFDTKIPGYHYRDIEKLDRQEAIERMGKQIEESYRKKVREKERMICEREMDKRTAKCN